MTCIRTPCHLDLGDLAANVILALHQMGGADVTGKPPRIRLVDPIPVYIADDRDFADRQCQSDLIGQTGWRGLILAHDNTAMACVEIFPPRGDSEAKPRFAIRGSQFANAFMKVLLAADQFMTQSDQGYEARVITFPSLFVTAIWLVGEDDWFFPTHIGIGPSPYVIPLIGRVFADMIAQQIKKKP
jgi:hypothetical protein